MNLIDFDYNKLLWNFRISCRRSYRLRIFVRLGFVDTDNFRAKPEGKTLNRFYYRSFHFHYTDEAYVVEDRNNSSRRFF